MLKSVKIKLYTYLEALRIGLCRCTGFNLNQSSNSFTAGKVKNSLSFCSCFGVFCKSKSRIPTAIFKNAALIQEVLGHIAHLKKYLPYQLILAGCLNGFP